MRITESCGCGASIDVYYSSPKEYPYDPDQQKQAADALNTWRALHASCVASRKEQAS